MEEKQAKKKIEFGRRNQPFSNNIIIALFFNYFSGLFFLCWFSILFFFRFWCIFTRCIHICFVSLCLNMMVFSWFSWFSHYYYFSNVFKSKIRTSHTIFFWNYSRKKEKKNRRQKESICYKTHAKKKILTIFFFSK